MKHLERSVREWLEKYPEDVRNKLISHFDYNTWDLIKHFWECSFIYCKILKHGVVLRTWWFCFTETLKFLISLFQSKFSEIIPDLMSCNLWSHPSIEDVTQFCILVSEKQNFSFFYKLWKKVNISKSFISDSETCIIFYASSNSYHDLLIVQMQILFPVEKVNECVSRLFLS